MSNAPADPANFCYRHPDRPSFVLCQRCGRTICTDCQTQAAVGVHCPECVKEARRSAPRRRPAVATRVRSAAAGGAPVVTYSLIGISVVVYLLNLVTGGLVNNYLVYDTRFTLVMPWTMLSSVFVHLSIFHIAFNMFSLFIFGRILEQSLGRIRFLALYLIAGFAGSVAVLVLNLGGAVGGASGAIFGMMAALLVIQRGLGGNYTGLLVLIGINLVIPFILPSSISWQAHVGGLIGGGLVGLVYMSTRARALKSRQILLTAGVAALFVVIAIVRIVIAL